MLSLVYQFSQQICTSLIEEIGDMVSRRYAVELGYERLDQHSQG
jgi:hypothetical protein